MAQITFSEISERDRITLAIASEEESRTYQSFADQLRS
jgi:hypothetical protein